MERTWIMSEDHKIHSLASPSYDSPIFEQLRQTHNLRVERRAFIKRGTEALKKVFRVNR